MTNATIVGSRIALRPATADDAEDIVRWRNEPEVAQAMFELPPASREDHLRWLAGVAARGDRHEFVIVDRSTGDRAVGTVGLSGVDRRHRRAEYGILIGERDARGRGLAHEASELILDHAFGPLDLRRVFLHTFAGNVQALRLFGRLGFVREGLLRRHAWRGDRFEDVIVMGLLCEDWLEGRRSRP